MKSNADATAAPEADNLGEGVDTGAHVAAEHDFGAQYDTSVTLIKPIQRASTEMATVVKLYLREPTAGDLRGIKLGELAQFDGTALAAVLPRIAMPRLAPAELQAIGLKDMIRIGNGVARFLF